MKLSELLDHVAASVLDDRTSMLNGAPDELWSDEVLARFFRRAEDIFATRTQCIKDDTTAACCEITLVAEQAKYDLHSSVIQVLSVTPADTSVDLQKFDYNSMRPRFDTSPGYFDINTSYVDTPGRPLWYATDAESQVLKVRPAPRAQDVTDIGTLNLRVARRPLTPLSHETPDAEPEIPERYHLDLCDYVAFRALSLPNVDSDGKREAKSFYAVWEASLRAARGERLTAEAAPVRWGFGGWANS